MTLACSKPLDIESLGPGSFVAVGNGVAQLIVTPRGQKPTVIKGEVNTEDAIFSNFATNQGRFEAKTANCGVLRFREQKGRWICVDCLNVLAHEQNFPFCELAEPLKSASVQNWKLLKQ